MKIKYKLATGETVYMEVYDELGEIILESNKDICK